MPRRATGKHPTGDPLALLVWLVRHCATERGGLQAQSVVTTGSWTGLNFLATPATITGQVGREAPITVALVT
jgi:2-keto-4-pentenoate hydratase